MHQINPNNYCPTQKHKHPIIIDINIYIYTIYNRNNIHHIYYHIYIYTSYNKYYLITLKAINMMKVEQQNNTTNVYAFEHDITDEEMERGRGESQQQELPKSLEKVLSWQAVRMNKLLFFLLMISFNFYPSTMLISLLLSNIYVGIAFGLFCVLVMPPLTFTSPDWGKGLFRKMILKEVKMFESEVKKGKAAMVFTMPIMMIVCGSVPIATLANPSSSNYTLFGPYTYIMIYIMLSAMALSMFIMPRAFLLQQPMENYIAKSWNMEIKKYIEKIEAILLTYNMENGKTKDDTLKAISVEQKKVENWAIQVNTGVSANNGFKAIMYLGQPTLFIVFAAVLQMNNADGANSLKIIVLVVMGFLMMLFFISFLSALTQPNKVWNRLVKKSLNDSCIQYKIVECFDTRFDLWLNNHELNAQRAFGFKITNLVLTRTASLIGSAFTIIIYLIMREELKVMMM